MNILIIYRVYVDMFYLLIITYISTTSIVIRTISLYNLYLVIIMVLDAIKSKSINILPGEYYVSNNNEVISTLLGSCISVCLYDEINGIGGMNHFMLPNAPSNRFINDNYEFDEIFLNSSTLRYGAHSMELIINEIIKIGGEKQYLKSKVFGGGNVMLHNYKTKTIGEQNIDFIFGYLKAENIKVVSHDVGGNTGRKLFFDTKNNSVYIRKIPITSIRDEGHKDVKNGEVYLFN